MDNVDSIPKQCNQCGETFERLGAHWDASSSCQHPTATVVLHELIEQLSEEGMIPSQSSIDQWTAVGD